MRKKLCLLLAVAMIIINTYGCGSVSSMEVKPSAEELAEASKVCGIVRNIDENVITIQLCGNLCKGTKGYGYLDVDNEYSDIKVGQSVLIYYEGKIKFEENDEKLEVYNIDVCYIEPYINDGKFVATMAISGDLLTEDATEKNTWISVKPLESEPEIQFTGIISTYDLVNKKAVPDENGNTIYFIFDVEDISEEVTVTYDINTMEIISITQ